MNSQEQRALDFGSREDPGVSPFVRPIRPLQGSLKQRSSKNSQRMVVADRLQLDDLDDLNQDKLRESRTRALRGSALNALDRTIRHRERSEAIVRP
jgi:hypothetical protein